MQSLVRCMVHVGPQLLIFAQCIWTVVRGPRDLLEQFPAVFEEEFDGILSPAQHDAIILAPYQYSKGGRDEEHNTSRNVVLRRPTLYQIGRASCRERV